jgi:exosortase
VAVAAAATLLAAPVVTGLVRQWYQDASTSHGIVLAIAAALVLRRQWPGLRSTEPTPSDAGFLALGASLLLYAAATVAGELFLLRVSILAAIASAVLTLAGRRVLRALAAPLALLLLAIPLPAIVVTSLTLKMQLLASQMAAVLLHGIGIAAVRDGNLLTLSAVTLEVAEACSGLRSIVSLVALIAVFKALRVLRTREALALAAATLPVAIVGNALRVTATGVLAETVGAWTARGWVHELAGGVAFAGMCGVLAGVWWMNRRRHDGEKTCESPALAW